MKAEDLAFVADALLALCEKSPGAPFYSSHALVRKEKLARRREPLSAHLMVSRGDDVLLRIECEEVFESAQLTPRQAEVLTRKLDGWTFEEIGSSSGHTKQAAQKVFVQALKKLARAFHVYPYKGLSDTYRYELRRGHRPSGFGRMSV